MWMGVRMFRDINWVQRGGNILFFMLIFVIMLDPTNTVLHLKDVFFVLLVGYNCLFFKPDFSYLPHILVIYGVICLGYVFSEMQMNELDPDMFMGIVKGFSPLVLLLWCHHYDIMKLTVVPALMVCVLITILYIVVSSSEVIELFVFNYVSEHNKMIMMTRRSFLGIRIFGMYYKSIISFVFALYICYNRLYNEKGKRFRLIPASLFMTFSFLISGTRATMLLPFFMLGLVSYKSILKWKRVRYFLYPLVAMFAIFLLVLILMLATEKGELSNAIKYAHLTSYAQLFEAHPEYFLFGQGPGAVFYSEGFHRWTSQTEWTYIELFRNYGLLSLVIVSVILLPLKHLLPYWKNEEVLGIMGAYVAFLFIAGTNPLLVSSTGMIVILAIYSYVHKLSCGAMNLKS